MKLWKYLIFINILLWLGLMQTFNWFIFTLGIVLSILLVLPMREIYKTNISVPIFLIKILWLIIYLTYYVYEVIKANLILSYLIIHPNMPIDPIVIEIPVKVKTNLGITMIANSITMTPGTLTLDYLKKENAYRVHAITGTKEKISSFVNSLQKIASKIEVEVESKE